MPLIIIMIIIIIIIIITEHAEDYQSGDEHH